MFARKKIVMLGASGVIITLLALLVFISRSADSKGLFEKSPYREIIAVSPGSTTPPVLVGRIDHGAHAYEFTLQGAVYWTTPEGENEMYLLRPGEKITVRFPSSQPAEAGWQ